jgi:hypothetical protein
LIGGEDDSVLNDKARDQIKQLIRQHTAKNTVSEEAARESLVRRGVYTADGKLTPAYGGKPKKKAGKPKQ